MNHSAATGCAGVMRFYVMSRSQRTQIKFSGGTRQTLLM
ncbi:hypothetical protein AIOL_003517 [Candidatus Rhodobacter oscarellae]|uniref:Uncharacterized protein n=1 Tax=Candidatus Rhodobacter oscarellae TaxID=1675527 RepID=A0A0J9E6Z5_9RHOB|nr:hypothetical protein AIOL_003517 [Candidatus Rhodobacter lobularis]